MRIAVQMTGLRAAARAFTLGEEERTCRAVPVTERAKLYATHAYRFVASHGKDIRLCWHTPKPLLNPYDRSPYIIVSP